MPTQLPTTTTKTITTTTTVNHNKKNYGYKGGMLRWRRLRKQRRYSSRYKDSKMTSVFYQHELILDLTYLLTCKLFVGAQPINIKISL